MSAYKDTSGMFTHKLETNSDKSSEHSSYLSSGFGYMKPEPNMKIEDEEDLLYGESGSAFKVTSVSINLINVYYEYINYNFLYRW